MRTEMVATHEQIESSSSSAVEAEMSRVVVSRCGEAVSDVYRRAVHWPKKPVINIRMIMWAQFKKNIGNVEQVRDILWQLVAKYPTLLEARMQ